MQVRPNINDELIYQERHGSRTACLLPNDGSLTEEVDSWNDLSLKNTERKAEPNFLQSKKPRKHVFVFNSDSYKSLRANKLLIQMQTWSRIPKTASLFRRPVCNNLSNDLEISRQRPATSKDVRHELLLCERLKLNNLYPSKY